MNHEPPFKRAALRRIQQQLLSNAEGSVEVVQRSLIELTEVLLGESDGGCTLRIKLRVMNVFGASSRLGLIPAIKALMHTMGFGLVDSKLLLGRGEIEFPTRQKMNEFTARLHEEHTKMLARHPQLADGEPWFSIEEVER